MLSGAGLPPHAYETTLHDRGTEGPPAQSLTAYHVDHSHRARAEALTQIPPLACHQTLAKTNLNYFSGQLK